MVYKRFTLLREQALHRIIQSPRPVSSRLGRVAITVALTALLSACAMTGLAPQQPRRQPVSMQQAQQAYAQGQYGQAARLYLKLAKQAPAKSRARLKIKAAEAALKAGDTQLAQQALTGVDRSTLSASQRSQADLAQAEVHLSQRRPRQALAALPEPGARVSKALAPEIWRVRAQALFALNRTLEATQALVARGHALSGADARRANDKALWRQLQKAPLQGAAVNGWQQAGTTVRGWIALARISRDYYFQPKVLDTHLQDWLNRHGQHPAANTIVPELRRAAAGNSGYPGQIALMLPLTGQLSAPAKAIRDGFLTAYYRQPQPRPQLRIYDTHPGQGDAATVFHKAVSDGASMVVGPLSPQAVAAVAQADQGNTPVLALNYLKANDKPPSSFYQMGLSPEDEAKQVALRATRDGLYKALALVPSGSWGDRMLQAFRHALSAQGGRVVDFARYNPSQADHSQSIIYLLGLNPKVARSHDKSKLKPRTDADFIFLAASPKQGRLIRPELRFYNATGIPVYATSSIYTGHPQPDKDVDMDGIHFCDMPWLLSPHQPEVATLRKMASDAWNNMQQQQPRLLALGIDAYQLIPALTSGALAQGHAFPGVTGVLHLGSDQRIGRRLVCAQFRNGRPTPLQSGTPASSTNEQ